MLLEKTANYLCNFLTKKNAKVPINKCNFSEFNFFSNAYFSMQMKFKLVTLQVFFIDIQIKNNIAK